MVLETKWKDPTPPVLYHKGRPVPSHGVSGYPVAEDPTFNADHEPAFPGARFNNKGELLHSNPTQTSEVAPSWLGEEMEKADAEAFDRELNAIPENKNPDWLRKIVAEANGVDTTLPEWLTKVPERKIPDPYKSEPGVVGSPRDPIVPDPYTLYGEPPQSETAQENPTAENPELTPDSSTPTVAK